MERQLKSQYEALYGPLNTCKLKLARSLLYIALLHYKLDDPQLTGGFRSEFKKKDHYFVRLFIFFFVFLSAWPLVCRHMCLQKSCLPCLCT